MRRTSTAMSLTTIQRYIGRRENTTQCQLENKIEGDLEEELGDEPSKAYLRIIWRTHLRENFRMSWRTSFMLSIWCATLRTNWKSNLGKNSRTNCRVICKTRWRTNWRTTSRKKLEANHKLFQLPKKLMHFDRDSLGVSSFSSTLQFCTLVRAQSYAHKLANMYTSKSKHTALFLMRWIFGSMGL